MAGMREGWQSESAPRNKPSSPSQKHLSTPLRYSDLFFPPFLHINQIIHHPSLDSTKKGHQPNSHDTTN